MEPSVINLQTYPQLITIPIFCSGALLFGLLIFLFIYIRTKNKLYLSTTFLSFTAVGFVFMEGLVSYFGTGQRLFYTAVHFHRLEQLFGVLFLCTVPLFFYHLLSLPPILKKTLKGLSIIGAGYTLFSLFIAFVVPDLFISMEEVVTELGPRIGNAGRGREGLFYTIRDVLLGVQFLTVIGFLIFDMVKNRRTKYLLTILVGIGAAGFFAADDIIHVYTGVHIGFFPQNSYARFPLGITVFLVLTMTAVLRQFINTANEVERAYAALNDSEQRFNQIAAHINEVFWLFDARTGGLLFISKAFSTIWGFDTEPLYDDLKQWSESIHPDDRNGILQDFQSPSKEIVTREYRIRRSDGTERWIQDMIYPIFDHSESVSRVARVSQDVTEQKKAEEQLIYLAYHDSLTGLPNRKSFFSRLEKSLRVAARSKIDRNRGVVFIDLDHFKDVNDSLGHITGDNLLREVAERISECVRTSDEVFRLGGDEFTIILNNLAEETDAAIVSEKIIKSLEMPYLFDEHVFSLGVSIGIAVYPKDGEAADILIKHADNALYEAKRDRNTYRFYTRDMQKNALRKVQIITLLRQAAENGELSLHYQPQVNDKGEVVGAEGLLRWTNSELGEVPPYHFIPIAEETGLMLSVGDWVLEQACRDAVRLQEEGLKHIALSINLSTKQLKSERIVESIMGKLSSYHIDPDRLHLEITESSLMEDTETALSHLTQLTGHGIRFAIDDFGTGYSSLSYLKSLPISTVKIDRSFIIEIPGNRQDTAVVKGIIDMVSGLQLDVIAEGADNREQVEFLHANNCPVIQGFYFSRPLPFDQFLQYAKEKPPREAPVEFSGRGEQ